MSADIDSLIERTMAVHEQRPMGLSLSEQIQAYGIRERLYQARQTELVETAVKALPMYSADEHHSDLAKFLGVLTQFKKDPFKWQKTQTANAVEYTSRRRPFELALIMSTWNYPVNEGNGGLASLVTGIGVPSIARGVAEVDPLNKLMCDISRAAYKEAGLPEDFLIHAEGMSREDTTKLLGLSDVLHFTGGSKGTELAKLTKNPGNCVVQVGRMNCAFVMDPKTMEETAKKLAAAFGPRGKTSCSGYTSIVLGPNVPLNKFEDVFLKAVHESVETRDREYGAFELIKRGKTGLQDAITKYKELGATSLESVSDERVGTEPVVMRGDIGILFQDPPEGFGRFAFITQMNFATTLGTLLPKLPIGKTMSFDTKLTEQEMFLAESRASRVADCGLSVSTPPADLLAFTSHSDGLGGPSPWNRKTFTRGFGSSLTKSVT